MERDTIADEFPEQQPMPAGAVTPEDENQGKLGGLRVRMGPQRRIVQS